MPTLLTNRKMDPALAARIEATLHQRRARTPTSSRPLDVNVLRAVVLLSFVGVLCAIGFAIRGRMKLDERRAALMFDWQARALDGQERARLARLEAWMLRLSAPYPGDRVDAALRAPGALAAILARPTIYVHGALDELVVARTTSVAESSTRDAFVLCLFDPPQSRDEAIVFEKVRQGVDRATIDRRAPNVHSLGDVYDGLPVLRPTFGERVDAARSMPQLARLQAELDHAPLATTKDALRATLMLAVIDERGDGAGYGALGGDVAHDVRVALVDLVTDRLLVSMRRRVDPSWISQGRRVRSGASLDQCRLAMDVIDGIESEGAPTTAP